LRARPAKDGTHSRSGVAVPAARWKSATGPPPSRIAEPALASHAASGNGEKSPRLEALPRRSLGTPARFFAKKQCRCFSVNLAAGLGLGGAAKVPEAKVLQVRVFAGKAWQEKVSEGKVRNA